MLAYDDGRAPTPTSAPHSGYERRQLGDCLVLVDTGCQPPGPFSEETHAGTLAFEFSSLLNRIVVNCGTPVQEGTAFRQAARATAAHSTLTLADVSSSRFLHWQAGGPGWRRRVLRGPKYVVVEPAPHDAAASVLASHDGYGLQFGWTHRRFLSIAEGGSLLLGVDQLVRAGTKAGAAQDYALRFHLHPSITAAVSDDQAGVFLDLPGDESWYFSASGLPLALEESVFLGMPNGAQRSQQIIARANSGQCVEINWMFQRYPEEPEGGAPPQDKTKAATDALQDAEPARDAPAAEEPGEAEG